MHLLLIGSYPPMVRALQRGMAEEGYVIDVASDAPEADHKATTAHYDAIILDLIPPEEAGLSLVRNLRRAGLRTHVLALAAPRNGEDKARDLDVGVSDWLIKPFALEELLLRLRALARPTPGGTDLP
jgi:two-component system copper resistance phosphate regulon response regulator CusR